MELAWDWNVKVTLSAVFLLETTLLHCIEQFTYHNLRGYCTSGPLWNTRACCAAIEKCTDISLYFLLGTAQLS